MKTLRVPRRGVTFFEVLILLAILLFLAAMLLPALFSVRVASSRTMSINNLKQIALACHVHNDNLRKMPPAFGKLGKYEGSAWFHIQPIIEPTAHLNRDATRVISTLLDPGDPTAPPENMFKGWLATTSYAANYMALKDTGVALGNGFPDGTAFTLLATTRYQMCNGTPNAWGYPTLYYWSPQIAYYSQARFQQNPAQSDCDPALAQAIDRAGILIATCDASARLLSAHVSPQTWGRLCDPVDGQNIDNDEF